MGVSEGHKKTKNTMRFGERIVKPKSTMQSSSRLTVSPAVELVLQPGDCVLQSFVPLLLPLVFLLPLLRRQLNVHRHRILNGLCSGEKKKKKEIAQTGMNPEPKTVPKKIYLQPVLGQY